MKNNLKDFEAKNKELYEQLEKLKSLDVKKLSDIDESQNFVSKKYDEVSKNVTNVKDLRDMRKKLNINIHQTHKNSKYSRRDCLEFAGIPWQAAENEDDCKAIIMMICRASLLAPRNGNLNSPSDEPTP